jgi:hypothetical protein
METHVSPADLRRFAHHESSATDVQRIARHLEGCEACRSAVPPVDLLASIAGADDEHLTFEQLAAIADGETRDGNGHAARCPLCRRELADLQQFRASRTLRRRTWAWPAVAAVVITLVAGGFAFTTIEGRRRTEARLVDVPLPADVLAMQTRRLTFRGNARKTDFDVIEPRNSVVMSDRPTFRWTGPAGAAAVVEVFAPDFTRVASSPPVTTGAWTSSVAFERGVVYRWQVTVGTMTIPAPPLPEALFIVARAEEADAVRRLERASPRPSLELASAYARAGDFSRARGELRALIREGKQPRAAETLLRRIDGVTR